ncbi:hypothetical protein PL81_27195 [Streptomyces sp. RSD-27]|nr:hypothetical protein PL81_27195 [Streptomyces sp. RSD-27]
MTARDSKDMHHLARLLAAPGREFHVLDLAAADTADPDAAARRARAGDAGPLLDARAKQMYRRRLAEIDDDNRQATSALFVTDPALPDMDTLHHGWVRESRRLTDCRR